MSKRIIASCTMASYLSLLALPVAAAPANQAAASVETVKGSVYSLNGEKNWAPKAGAQVAAGSVVRTGKDGEAVLVFPGGDRVRLAPDSEIAIVAADTSSVQLKLYGGRILGSAVSTLQVDSGSASARATRGQFVLDASSEAAGLKVLDGDASLAARQPGESVAYASLAMFPPGGDMMSLLGLDNLAYEQSIGGFVFGGGKGLRVRNTNTNESVGGLEDASPDQDVPQPPPRTPPRVYQPVETPPPVVETPPPVVESPPPVVETPPPVETTPTAVGGGGFPWPVLAVLGAAGLAIGLANIDDDNNDVFIGTPSPAQP